MKFMLIACSEFESPRFNKLCEKLGKTTQEEKERVKAIFMTWRCTWGRECGPDTGLWFNTSLNEVGAWAGTVDTLAWGQALLHAGYIAQIEKVYPPPLAKQGFLAIESDGTPHLDSCISMLRSRGAIRTLILYLSNREKRAIWSERKKLNANTLEAEGKIPKGWLSRSNPDTPTGSGPLPSLYDRVWKFYKEGQLLEALCALDKSSLAVKCWQTALQKNPSRVRKTLADAMETIEGFVNMRNPAAVVMSSFKEKGLLLDRTALIR